MGNVTQSRNVEDMELLVKVRQTIRRAARPRVPRAVPERLAALANEMGNDL